VEVGDVLPDDDPTGNVGLTAAHDLARGARAGGVAVEQKRDHHPGMERRLAPEVALVMSGDGREVKGGDRGEKEVDETPFGEPVVRRRGEDVALVGRPLAIGLAHATISPHRVTGDRSQRILRISTSKGNTQTGS